MMRDNQHYHAQFGTAAEAASAEVKRDIAAAQAYLSLVACQHTNEHANATRKAVFQGYGLGVTRNGLGGMVSDETIDHGEGHPGRAPGAWAFSFAADAHAHHHIQFLPHRSPYIQTP